MIVHKFSSILPLLAGLSFLASLPGRSDSATPNLSPDSKAPEAWAVLRDHYLDFNRLDLKSPGRLEDWVNASKGGLSLTAPSPAEGLPGIITATLPGGVIYWRLATFQPETSWSDLEASLDKECQQGAKGIILDLRNSLAPDDYDGAARAASSFIPPGTPLFMVATGGGDLPAQVYRSTAIQPPVNLPMIVLINQQTYGAAEALGAILKERGALMMGNETPGNGALYGQQKLSSGQVLRYATVPVTLADGTPLWRHPVIPDISLSPDETIEKNALAQIDRHGVLDVIRQSEEHPRLSEASLVRGDDPELDAYVLNHEKKPADAPTTASQVVQDTTLIDAIASLKAIQVSQIKGGASSPASTSHDGPSTVQ